MTQKEKKTVRKAVRKKTEKEAFALAPNKQPPQNGLQPPEIRQQASSNDTPKSQNPGGQQVAQETKKGILKRIMGNPRLLSLLLLLALCAIAGGISYWQLQQSRIYIEKAEISAPIISLSPQIPGILDKVNVKEGDVVHKNKIVAEVDGQPILAKTNGIVIEVQNTPGQLVSSQNSVVQMIDPQEFRVIGQIEEDKGLSDIRVGQRVIFTVDAFGSKEYTGVVDSISPTSRTSDIVFSISDKRQENQFDVKVSFNVDDYPELKNGMSAKMWVYK
jgi:multidrug resistance efflux pump